MSANAKLLLEKIQALSEERLNEVEDFVDFIRFREQQRMRICPASTTVFNSVWDNPEDDVYDAL